MNNKLTIEYVFGTIVPAWYRIVFHDPEVEKLALERGFICVGDTKTGDPPPCEFLGQFVRSKKWGAKCTKCGCPIISKVRATENGCPAKKWPR